MASQARPTGSLLPPCSAIPSRTATHCPAAARDTTYHRAVVMLHTRTQVSLPQHVQQLVHACPGLHVGAVSRQRNAGRVGPAHALHCCLLAWPRLQVPTTAHARMPTNCNYCSICSCTWCLRTAAGFLSPWPQPEDLSLLVTDCHGRWVCYCVVWPTAVSPTAHLPQPAAAVH